MRIQLRTPTPESTEAKPPGAAPAAVDPVVSGVTVMGPPAENRKSRTISRGDRALHLINRWGVVLPVLVFCCAMLAWSLCLRLPDNHRWLAVSARALKPVGEIENPISGEELSRWRQQAEAATSGCLRQREQLGPVLNLLESEARRLGWRIETQVNPPVQQPGGLAQLSLYPVIFQLEDDGEQSLSAYARLLSWLRVVSNLPHRTEVVELRLRSAGAALAKAQVEVQWYGLNPHEATATK